MKNGLIKSYYENGNLYLEGNWITHKSHTRRRRAGKLHGMSA